ncbi:hypothetical protein [Alteromonas lipolytica]|uniref:Uncharacterized protein n=1 Tax=Alteromonas lipolytica TaxID=1856405 RepID=A0A1E8FFL1_9ALTE|nr:hypothetical protein [Alteromonas lipolytica]OFI34722.1 hypothetical protein BFC17_14170 [Alteromonas lipolytica]GGF53480.1 hypothetical protein GCM10011338_02010 [Alteromonas lipolytica]
MSDKKPTSPILGWFEAGLGLFTEQLNAANQQVQQKVGESQKTLDELASRGAEVEAQLRKTVDPSQWLELWRQSPLHNWMPAFTTPKQKRAMQIEALSTKVDLLVEQVALLAAKQAAAKAQAEATAKTPATKRAASTTRSTAKKPAAKAATTKPATPKAATTRKRAPAKPKDDADKAE